MTTVGNRVAVYNRYWPSRGGGERHAGMVAQVLGEMGADVDLLGHDDVDLDALADHLGLDLSNCRMRVVPDTGESALRAVTGEYDLFVNGSYMSALQSEAAKSIYLCYFPTPADHDLAAWRRQLIRMLRRFVRPARQATTMTWGTGWFPAEGGARRRWTWTNGDASISVGAGDALDIRFDLGRPGQSPTELSVLVNSRLIASVAAESRFRSMHFAVPPSTATREVRFRSPTFTPGERDPRQLGVALSRMRFSGGGIGVRERAAIRFPWLLRDPRDLKFLSTYDVVLANSRYTARWIRRFWQVEPDVLYPPVDVDRFDPAPLRTKTIVSVGRFFPPSDGHSKRQLEQVQAFGRMVRSGQLPEWTLHLIGGCEPRLEGYLSEVRAAAAGLPIVIHANAPRKVLEDLVNSAAIQWSATGYGANDETTPWASEHFGMTTVEAMAGGCVPIVIDKAGQREIVRDGVDGFRWSTLDQLIGRTVQVATDEQLRARLAAAAMLRAQTYSDAAFAEGFHELVRRRRLIGVRDPTGE